MAANSMQNDLQVVLFGSLDSDRVLLRRGSTTIDTLSSL